MVAGTLLGGSLAGASAAAASTTAVATLSAVSTTSASTTGVSGPVLVQAYLSARHLPAGAVARIRAGSLRTASVAGTQWAIADFTPSASAALGVQSEFQDGGSTGVFSQAPGQSWRLVQTGPYGCGDGLPALVRLALGLPAAMICQTPLATQRLAAVAAAAATTTTTTGQSIANIALAQVGVGDTPAVTSFEGVDCDPYTPMVGALSPNADGCGLNSNFNLEDENEEWCSDFAKWAWQQAGVTADMTAIDAGAGSFYDWGAAQDEPLRVDAGTPVPGDAVVFFPPGAIAAPAYADHVGIVTGVNSGGTVNLVNGDFLGTSNISVQYNTKVALTGWAGEVWGPGEQWVLVAPPAGTQQAAPVPVVSGSHAGVTGTVAGFSASGTAAGGSVTRYQWTFGYGSSANQAGASVSTVFPGAGIYPVTLTATSSLGTVATRTWDVDVAGASSAVTSIPSDAVWYLTAPVGQYLFLPTAAGGLAAETSTGITGAGWLQQAIPGQLSSGPTALAYPDPAVADAMTPHAYFRSAGGTLAQTYLGPLGWITQTLAGQPEPGSALAATTGTTAGSVTPAVFYFGAAGQLSQTTGQGTSWATSALPGPDATDASSLAVANTTAGADVFYLGSSGALTVDSDTSQGWHSATISSPYGVAAASPLAAISTGAGQAGVFFVDAQGTVAEATSAGSAWGVQVLPGTTATTSLAAATTSGTQEVFWLSGLGQAAVTAGSGTQWQTSTLPGPATRILAVSTHPGLPQELFLADGAALHLDASTGSSWTAATLPSTPATFASRVLLYAATPGDEVSANAAASAAGLPASAVTEDFATAWAAALTGNYLVIAVGQAADDALYFNTCGWSNPSGEGAGGTPFDLSSEPLDQLPGVDLYENAAAATATQTPALATDLAYYATHGARPAGVTTLPAQGAPARICAGSPG
jgi:CHAP domain-containing protein/PKD domain-containing protein